MKHFKALVLGLALVLGGALYAANQTAPEQEKSCCTSCCCCKAEKPCCGKQAQP